MKKLLALLLALTIFPTFAFADVLTQSMALYFSPYMDSQIGAVTGANPEGRPTAPDGWLNNGQSQLYLFPIGDGSLVFVHAQFLLRTDNVASFPNPTRNYNYMLVAGLPPVDPLLAPPSGQFTATGNFEGLQATSGAPGPNLSLDVNYKLNDAHGSRWYVVCSFWGTPPYNAWWNYDGVDSEQHNFPNRCWLNGQNTDPLSVNYGKTPFRLSGGLTFVTTWAAVEPWLASQEIAGTCQTISNVNNACVSPMVLPVMGARPRK